MALVIKCKEHFAAVKKFAREQGLLPKLVHELSWLNTYCDNNCVCELYSDFAPYSFTFVMYRKHRHVRCKCYTEDGPLLGCPVCKNGIKGWTTIYGQKPEAWFNGGVIYHHNAASGAEFPVLSVTLSGRKDSRWEVHT